MPKGIEGMSYFNRDNLKSLADQLVYISSLTNSLEKNYGFTEQLIASNKAAMQLRQTLSKSYEANNDLFNIRAFQRELTLSGMSLEKYKQQLTAIGTDGTKAFSQLSRSLMTAETAMRPMEGTLGKIWSTLGNTLKWQASSMIVQNVAKNIASAVSYSKQLNTNLTDIQIVTNQSNAYMKEFAKNANTAAKALSTTTNEYSKAALIFYQQGLDNKAVQERAATTIKLANVSRQSAKVVSDQLTAVWNNFYNGSKSLEYYADAMAALGATTASSSSEIAKGLEKFSAIAQSTGLSFEYASSALATVVANTRQSADAVGTSFKTLFSRLQGLSLGEVLDDGTTLNKYSKALLSVGVNIKKANGDLKNMDTILSELGEKWQSLAKDEKIALAQTVGGARNYTGLMSLMDNWDDFIKNLKTAQTAQGTLQRQADIYAKSWDAASAHVRAATESIYSNLIDDKFTIKIVNAFASITEGIGSMQTALGGARGSFLMLANLASRTFQPQLAGSIDKTIATLQQFTPSGKQKILNLREQAKQELLTNFSISDSAKIDEYFRHAMSNRTNLGDRYNELLKAGKLTESDKLIYQRLFANYDTQVEDTVAAMEENRKTFMDQRNRMRDNVRKYNRAILQNDYGEKDFNLTYERDIATAKERQRLAERQQVALYPRMQKNSQALEAVSTELAAEEKKLEALVEQRKQLEKPEANQKAAEHLYNIRNLNLENRERDLKEAKEAQQVADEAVKQNKIKQAQTASAINTLNSRERAIRLGFTQSLEFNKRNLENQLEQLQKSQIIPELPTQPVRPGSPIIGLQDQLINLYQIASGQGAEYFRKNFNPETLTLEETNKLIGWGTIDKNNFISPRQSYNQFDALRDFLVKNFGEGSIARDELAKVVKASGENKAWQQTKNMLTAAFKWTEAQNMRRAYIRSEMFGETPRQISEASYADKQIENLLRGGKTKEDLGDRDRRKYDTWVGRTTKATKDDIARLTAEINQMNAETEKAQLPLADAKLALNNFLTSTQGQELTQEQQTVLQNLYESYDRYAAFDKEWKVRVPELEAKKTRFESLRQANLERSKQIQVLETKKQAGSTISEEELAQLTKLQRSQQAITTGLRRLQVDRNSYSREAWSVQYNNLTRQKHNIDAQIRAIQSKQSTSISGPLAYDPEIARLRKEHAATTNEMGQLSLDIDTMEKQRRLTPYMERQRRLGSLTRQLETRNRRLMVNETGRLYGETEEETNLLNQKTSKMVPNTLFGRTEEYKDDIEAFETFVNSVNGYVSEGKNLKGLQHFPILRYLTTGLNKKTFSLTDASPEELEKYTKEYEAYSKALSRRQELIDEQESIAQKIAEKREAITKVQKQIDDIATKPLLSKDEIKQKANLEKQLVQLQQQEVTLAKDAKATAAATDTAQARVDEANKILENNKLIKEARQQQKDDILAAKRAELDQQGIVEGLRTRRKGLVKLDGELHNEYELAIVQASKAKKDQATLTSTWQHIQQNIQDKTPGSEFTTKLVPESFAKMQTLANQNALLTFLENELSLPFGETEFSQSQLDRITQRFGWAYKALLGGDSTILEAFGNLTPEQLEARRGQRSTVTINGKEFYREFGSHNLLDAEGFRVDEQGQKLLAGQQGTFTDLNTIINNKKEDRRARLNGRILTDKNGNFLYRDLNNDLINNRGYRVNVQGELINATPIMGKGVQLDTHVTGQEAFTSFMKELYTAETEYEKKRDLILKDTVLKDDERQQKLTAAQETFQKEQRNIITGFANNFVSETAENIRYLNLSESKALTEKLLQEYDAKVDQQAPDYRLNREQLKTELDSLIEKGGTVSQYTEAFKKWAGDAAYEAMMKEQEKTSITWGNAMTSTISAIGSLGTLIPSVSNTIKTMGDESATAMQKIGALGSMGMSVGYSMSGLKNIVENAGKTIGETGLSLGAFSGITIGAIAAIMAATEVIKEYKANTMEGATERLSNMQATGQQIQSELQTKADQLPTIQAQYNDLVDNLKTTLPNSEEYYTTLTNALTTAQNIIDTYDLEYGKDYGFDQNGIPTITADTFKTISKKAQQDALDASITNLQLGYAQKIFGAYENGFNDMTKKGIDVTTSSGTYSNAFSLYDILQMMYSGMGEAFPGELSLEDRAQYIQSLFTKNSSFLTSLQGLISNGEISGLHPQDLKKAGLKGTITEIDLQNLKEALGLLDNASDEKLYTTLAQMSLIPNNEKDLQSYYTENLVSPAQSALKGNIMGLASVSAQRLSNSILNKEYIGYLFAQQLEQNPVAMKELISFIASASNPDFFFDRFGSGSRTPEQWYEHFAGKPIEEEWKDNNELIAYHTAEAILKEGFFNPEKFKEAGLTLKGFEGLQFYQSLLENAGLPSFNDLNIEQVNTLLEEKKAENHQQLYNDEELAQQLYDEYKGKFVGQSYEEKRAEYRQSLKNDKSLQEAALAEAYQLEYNDRKAFYDTNGGIKKLTEEITNQVGQEFKANYLADNYQRLYDEAYNNRYEHLLELELSKTQSFNDTYATELTELFNQTQPNEDDIKRLWDEAEQTITEEEYQAAVERVTTKLASDKLQSQISSDINTEATKETEKYLQSDEALELISQRIDTQNEENIKNSLINAWSAVQERASKILQSWIDDSMESFDLTEEQFNASEQKRFNDGLAEYTKEQIQARGESYDKYLNSLGIIFKEQYEALYNDIGEAFLISFTDQRLNGENDERMFASDLGKLAWGLSYSNLQQVYNAITAANGVGLNTAREVERLIISDRASSGFGEQLSQSTLDILSKYNFENNLGSVYENTQLRRYAKTEAEKDKYERLLINQIKDVGEEKGFFNMLYKSSGFDDVMASLSELFTQAGNISAANIEKLATKQEELNYLLKIGEEHLEGTVINSAGLASIFEELAKDTITAQSITSELISSLSLSKRGESLDQRALGYVSNLDLGTSGEDFLDYFQNIGKAYYQAEKTNWGFNSEQMRNIVNLLGNTEIKEAFYEANRSGNVKFPELMKQMPSYFTDFLDAVAGKKGKGGGGPADVFSFLYSALGGEGISDEQWFKWGFKIDKNGNISTGTGLSQEELENQLAQQLVERAGYDEESAKVLAAEAAAMAHASGNIGAFMEDAASEMGLRNLLGFDLIQSNVEMHRARNEGDIDLSSGMYWSKDTSRRRVINTKDLEAYFNQNREYIKSKYGIDNATDFQTWYEGQNANATLLNYSPEYFGTHTGAVTLQGAMEAQKYEYTGQDAAQAFEDFSAIAKDFGALLEDENGIIHWDYDKLIDLTEAMGGTSADTNAIIQQYLDQFTGKLVGRDVNGNEILFGAPGYQSFYDWSKAIETGESTEWIKSLIGEDQTAASIYTAFRSMFYQNQNGDWELDLTGSKRENAAASALYDKQYTQFTTGSQTLQNEIINAAYERAKQDITSLTPFEKQLLIAVGEIEQDTDDIYQIAEDGAEGETAAERAKARGKYDGEKFYDEEGNEVELPYKNPAQGSGSGYSGVATPTGPNGKRYQDAKTGIWYVWDDSAKNNQGGTGGYRPEEVPMAVDEDKKTPNAMAGDPRYSASGQNNHTLAFATGKEGQIAVTGELGPELRIKEDGTAELLGKHGREYAWVNPNDKIYTAAQTASILKNNNIPELEGLAKGIRNYIPGFLAGTSDWAGTSSGGGGGGGEEEWKDPRYDPNTLKIRDVVERYYPFIQQLQFIAKDLEHISTVVDRSWGQEHLKAIQQQTEVLRKQEAKQQEKINAAQAYLYNDKDAITTMFKEVFGEWNEWRELEAAEGETKIPGTEQINSVGQSEGIWPVGFLHSVGAEFDEYGVITNYDELVTKLVELYNRNAEENASDKEAQYKFQEQLKDIQFYNETLMQLREDQEALFATQNAIFDNDIKLVVDELSLMNEINSNYLRTINYNVSKYKDDAYLSAKYVTLLAEKNTLLEKEIEANRSALFKLLNKNINNNPNEEISSDLQELLISNPQEFLNKIKYFNEIGFQDFTPDEINHIETIMETLVSYMSEIEQNQKTMIDMIGDTIKSLAKNVERAVNKFDYFADIQNSVENIVNLTNRRLTNIDSTVIKSMHESQVKNAMNKMSGAKTAMETAQKMYDGAWDAYKKAEKEYNTLKETEGVEQKELDNAKLKMNEYKKQVQTAEDILENATKGWYQSWEDALKEAQEAYKAACEEAARTFEESFSPFYTTIELLEAAFTRQKKLTQLYTDDYNRIYNLSKLNREITQSIIDTDNLKSKSRLRDLQSEINSLQESGVELSEYDLDILDKKYKLELARQALEDSRDAKSVVRLSRDNNGNWGYVYTANQEEVADAEQKYEDAIYEMEKANEEYIDSIEDQILQVQIEAQQAIQALKPEDFNSYEDYVAQVMEIYSAAKKTQDYLSQQLDNAFKNQNYLDPFITSRYGANDHNLTDEFRDLTISKILGLNSMQGVTNEMVNRFAGYIEEMTTAFKEYAELQKEIWELAGYDINDAAGAIEKIYGDIDKQSDTQVGVVAQEAREALEAFNAMMAAVEEKVDEQSELVAALEKLVEALNKFIDSAGTDTGPIQINANGQYNWQTDEEVKQAIRDGKVVDLTYVDANGTQQEARLMDNHVPSGSLLGTLEDLLARSESINLNDEQHTLSENVLKMQEYLNEHGVVYAQLEGNTYALTAGQQEANQRLSELIEGIQNGNLQEEEIKAKLQDLAGLMVKAEDIAVDTDNANQQLNDLNNNTQETNTRLSEISGGVTKIIRHLEDISRGYSNQPASSNAESMLSGGYTGRWASALSGMYTGEWSDGSATNNGRWALLHQKEIVLNAHDTENFLDAISIIRQLDNLSNWMANGLGELLTPQYHSEKEVLEQNIHIEASFPNVTNHNEIEQAFNNIVNMASQYANRK